MVEANLEGPDHPDGGSFVGAMGMRFRGHAVTASVDSEGSMTVVVDNLEVPNGRFYQEWDGSLATVEVDPYVPTLGHVVVVSTPLLMLRVHAVQPYFDNSTGYNRAHLDFAFTLQAMPTAMHGVLGQTLFSSGSYPASDMQFHGDGNDADYIVPHLYSTNHRFNRFIPDDPPKLQILRCRALATTGYKSLPHPKVASMAHLYA